MVLRHPERQLGPELEQTIAAALIKAGMLEAAGDFFEGLGRHEEALDAFRRGTLPLGEGGLKGHLEANNGGAPPSPAVGDEKKISAEKGMPGLHPRCFGQRGEMDPLPLSTGRCYRRCKELAARYQPSLISSLEEEWGDWLAAQKQWDQASRALEFQGGFWWHFKGSFLLTTHVHVCLCLPKLAMEPHLPPCSPLLSPSWTLRAARLSITTSSLAALSRRSSRPSSPGCGPRWPSSQTHSPGKLPSPTTSGLQRSGYFNCLELREHGGGGGGDRCLLPRPVSMRPSALPYIA